MILMFFKSGLRSIWVIALCLLITHFYYEYRIGEELTEIKDALSEHSGDSDILASVAEIYDEVISFLFSKLDRLS